MNRPVEILILSDDQQRRSRWARFLTDAETRLWVGLAELPADAPIDVIVRDEGMGDDQMPAGRLSRRLSAGEIAVVGIGQKHSTDVCLPSDVSSRELRLACRLLAETVRLRRECNRSRRLQRVLNRMALTDALTGLPNRRAWDDELLQRDVAPNELRTTRCIALLDLDHFKQINDNLGHLAGDRLLQVLGQQISQAIADHDFAARLGGDEFAMILEGADPAELTERVESIRRSVCEKDPNRGTASVGFSITTQTRTASCYDLLTAADVALRKAKLGGRNRSLSEPPWNTTRSLPEPGAMPRSSEITIHHE